MLEVLAIQSPILQSAVQIGSAMGKMKRVDLKDHKM